MGGRTATAGLRPLRDAAGAVAWVGVSLERRAMDRFLEGEELERLLESPRLHEVGRRVLASRGTDRLIDAVFESGLLDRFFERLLASDGLWHLIDEVATSPAVSAAIAEQGLGFADQVGEQVRTRSSRADDWLEHAAQRLIHRRAQTALARSGPGAA